MQFREKNPSIIQAVQLSKENISDTLKFMSSDLPLHRRQPDRAGVHAILLVGLDGDGSRITQEIIRPDQSVEKYIQSWTGALTAIVQPLPGAELKFAHVGDWITVDESGRLGVASDEEFHGDWALDASSRPECQVWSTLAGGTWRRIYLDDAKAGDRVRLINSTGRILADAEVVAGDDVYVDVIEWEVQEDKTLLPHERHLKPLVTVKTFTRELPASLPNYGTPVDVPRRRPGDRIKQMDLARQFQPSADAFSKASELMAKEHATPLRILHPERLDDAPQAIKDVWAVIDSLMPPGMMHEYLAPADAVKFLADTMRSMAVNDLIKSIPQLAASRVGDRSDPVKFVRLAFEALYGVTEGLTPYLDGLAPDRDRSGETLVQWVDAAVTALLAAKNRARDHAMLQMPVPKSSAVAYDGANFEQYAVAVAQALQVDAEARQARANEMESKLEAVLGVVDCTEGACWELSVDDNEKELLSNVHDCITKSWVHWAIHAVMGKATKEDGKTPADETDMDANTAEAFREVMAMRVELATISREIGNPSALDAASDRAGKIRLMWDEINRMHKEFASIDDAFGVTLSREKTTRAEKIKQMWNQVMNRAGGIEVPDPKASSLVQVEIHHEKLGECEPWYPRQSKGLVDIAMRALQHNDVVVQHKVYSAEAGVNHSLSIEWTESHPLGVS